MPSAGTGIPPLADADGALPPGTGISPGLPGAGADAIPGIGICPSAGLPATAFIPGTGIPAALVAIGRAGVPDVAGTGMSDAVCGCFSGPLPSDRFSCFAMAPPRDDGGTLRMR
ncbi:hypothetical protein [Streptomyces venetus]|uniref:hypothetical protein n=1 Tax=Streptomyces venetus TaxID=1701086 RepID=UPI003C2E0665